MTKVRRSERGSDRGSFILLGLMVLAIAASIVMLVTGNIDVLKIALIVSLWAAFVGLFLVARSRKETERVRLLKQQESAVAQAEISRLEAAADIESETLAEIRDQLEVMRTQLEALTNLAFPESGMIQAQARRIDELPASPRRPLFDTSSFPAVDLMRGTPAPAGEEVTPTQTQEPTDAATVPTPETEPVLEVTAEPIIEVEVEPAVVVAPDPSPAPEADTTARTFVQIDEDLVSEVADELEEETSTIADTDEGESGRRHSSSASGSVSVAELLRRKQDEQAGSYHGRRRKEDR